jgi:hypothetical protein
VWAAAIDAHGCELSSLVEAAGGVVLFLIIRQVVGSNPPAPPSGQGFLALA